VPVNFKELRQQGRPRDFRQFLTPDGDDVDPTLCPDAKAEATVRFLLARDRELHGHVTGQVVISDAELKEGMKGSRH